VPAPEYAPPRQQTTGRPSPRQRSARVSRPGCSYPTPARDQVGSPRRPGADLRVAGRSTTSAGEGWCSARAVPDLRFGRTCARVSTDGGAWLASEPVKRFGRGRGRKAGRPAVRRRALVPDAPSAAGATRGSPVWVEPVGAAGRDAAGQAVLGVGRVMMRQLFRRGRRRGQRLRAGRCGRCRRRRPRGCRSRGSTARGSRRCRGRAAR
jgi:hypothetical protein